MVNMCMTKVTFKSSFLLLGKRFHPHMKLPTVWNPVGMTGFRPQGFVE